MWSRQSGFHPITVWRMRRKGMLETVNICGRQYITDEAIETFTKRARSGEFARIIKIPARS